MSWRNAKRKTKSLLFSRLQNPYECPFNGSRRQDCACRNDYLAAGFTVFSKIRFDVASMQIKSKRFGSFSQCEHSIEVALVVIMKLSFHLIIDPIMPFLDKQNSYFLWEFSGNFKGEKKSGETTTTSLVSLSQVVKWCESCRFIFHM